MPSLPPAKASPEERIEAAIEELQQPKPAELIRGVVGEAQEGDEVLDVSGLQIAQPAVLDERDATARQLDLEKIRVVVRAKENGLVAQFHAFLAGSHDPLTDQDGLLALVAWKCQLGRSAAPALGPQLLWEPGAVLFGNGVCDCEDRRCRAVVALELARVSIREPLGEVEDMTGARGAEPVDRLEIVAHDRQTAAC